MQENKKQYQSKERNLIRLVRKGTLRTSGGSLLYQTTMRTTYFFLTTQEVEGNNTINNCISIQTHGKCSQKLVHKACQPERKLNLFGKCLCSHDFDHKNYFEALSSSPALFPAMFKQIWFPLSSSAAVFPFSFAFFWKQSTVIKSKKMQLHTKGFSFLPHSDGHWSQTHIIKKKLRLKLY